MIGMETEMMNGCKLNVAFIADNIWDFCYKAQNYTIENSKKSFGLMITVPDMSYLKIL